MRRVEIDQTLPRKLEDYWHAETLRILTQKRMQKWPNIGCTWLVRIDSIRSIRFEKRAERFRPSNSSFDLKYANAVVVTNHTTKGPYALY